MDSGSEPSGAANSGLSLRQKAALTTGANYWLTQAAPAIGLPAIRLSDGPHGLRLQDDSNPDHLGIGASIVATCFPPAVTLASSWDLALIERVGAALAREARARGVQVILGPGLNIKRTPLCGRNFEYFSEDPLLSGLCAAAQVRGIQSQGVGACVKHFAANNQEHDRHRISADVDERPLWEIYLRGFQTVVKQASPWMVMTSYNRLNGVYTDESHWLLSDVLKGEWGYDGVVVSDWGAVYDPVAAVRAGLDLRMPGVPEDDTVHQAALRGAIPEDRLDDVVQRLRRLAGRVAFGSADEVDMAAQHALAREAAATSAVLLKNERDALPLRPDGLATLAVIGELARSPRYQGAGSSRVNPHRLVHALDSLRERLGASTEVAFAAGYRLDADGPQPELVAEALQLASRAGTVLLFLGLPDTAEAEGRDRRHIDLPHNQVHLIETLAGVAPKLVVALSNGAVVTTAPWRHHADAIVEFWLTGQAHGEAVADVLLGDVNPSGRLAETIPCRLQDTPAYLDYPGENGHVRYGEGLYVGYRHYDARDMAVDFPFGHGLSYTRFAYAGLSVRAHPASDEVALTVQVSVTNTGARSGSEVVQVYLQDRSGLAVCPPQELRGFARVALEPGQTRQIEIGIPRERLCYRLPGMGWRYHGGEVEVRVGASSRDIRLAQVIELERTPVERPLTGWSTMEEWVAHPVLGPRLQTLFEQRGGARGRAGQLLADPVGRQSILAVPLLGLAQFPGFPLDERDVQSLLDRGP
ncbi:beta-glucosidase family protein [Hydrogenophaga pseudoflava]|uniref:beta-glucosidase family protein n=1 Tax=Hydrogenophaga pseudoflava TaxID=47421 RepID=UPI0027E568A2|nr:glycoside hydrolase family 3 C-terminal domain-containing protein [Hydrogenophaga pseudoflava]MDQ7747320.1 glycoside hydrolase family 3 C-terminal domain-containing protein [Hydrogenophaga pseudoflava]